MTSHKHGLISLTDVINSNQGFACNNSYVVECYKVDRREEPGTNTGTKLPVSKVMNLEELVKEQ